jgi:ABC-type protease/lipase transport system fused ATPase/permease subunit
MPEACRLPNSDPTLCPEVPAAALYEALFAVLREHEEIALGIGGCFDSGRSTLGRMAAVVNDWRDADAAIRIVSDELTRWDVRDAFWVSVEPMLCGGVLAGELAR